ncbi:hypothetical protein PRK78_002753 [Emydomyces testavorans]|uniref:Uncharacterized protein n=1 Tax=Emydomyces testavorans TaxID=2070801 RepID=A0AAF0DFK5_9EURO|nr:hypothetical protein PRK78_002753 [Emydomyces testavorans]
MEWVGSALRKWTASCFSCVWPENENHTPSPQEQRPAFERVVSIYHNQQPQAIPPMKLVIYDDLPSPNEPRPRAASMSNWVAQGRDLASKVNKRRTLLSRPSSWNNRRKKRTISAPTNFRRVPTAAERRFSFRPLELSIYLPGNELPDLPEFTNFDLDHPRFPPRAVWSPTRNSYYRRYSDAPPTFSVPRKPIGSLRRRSVVTSNEDGSARHRSTLSDSKILQSMTTSSQSTLHSRSQSTPVAHLTSDIERPFRKDVSIDWETPSLDNENPPYSPGTDSPAPLSPLTDMAMSAIPNAPPRSDSLAHWLMTSPSSPNCAHQSLPNRHPSYERRIHKTSNSTLSSMTTLTAASRRTASFASSMTSAGTLYQSPSLHDISEKNYELALENAVRSKIDNPRYDETHPTIYESEQYQFSPPSPNSPRMFGMNDIGVAF